MKANFKETFVTILIKLTFNLMLLSPLWFLGIKAKKCVKTKKNQYFFYSLQKPRILMESIGYLEVEDYALQKAIKIRNHSLIYVFLGSIL